MSNRFKKLVKCGLMATTNPLGTHDSSVRTNKLRSNKKGCISLEFVTPDLHEDRKVGVATVEHGEGRGAGSKESTVYNEKVNMGGGAMPVTRRLGGGKETEVG
jgi:hypothetical protein